MGTRVSSGIPAIERVAGKFSGASDRCVYRKRYAAFICGSEAKHPLVSWRIVDWEDRPPLRILHYSGKRRNEGSNYEELLSVTLDSRSGDWVVTKYDSLY